MLRKSLAIAAIAACIPLPISAATLLDGGIKLSSQIEETGLPAEKEGGQETAPSPYIAFGMAAAPIPLSLLVMYVQMIVRAEDWPFWNDPEVWMEYLVSIYPASMSILTIPAHMYVESSIRKVTICTVLKVAFWAVTATAVPSEYPFEPSFTMTKMMTLFFGIAGIGATYLFELADITLTAKRAREASSARGFFLQPLAGPGEYRLQLGYRF